MRHRPYALLTYQALCELVEATVWVSDRDFFDQQPQRRYRVRPAWDIELEALSRSAEQEKDKFENPPPGCMWWMAVHRLSNGFRTRVPFTAPHDLAIDPPEKQARDVWKRYSPPITREIEQKLESIP